MGLIPTDVGVNLRTQVDSPLRSAAPITEVPTDLPDLRPGQRFSATIQQILPDATYKALVAGKSITLSLNEGAKAGDTLELVLVDKTPQTLLARLAADSSAAGRAEPYPQASLSPAARLIGTLLPAPGETPQPVALNQGQPLIPAEMMGDSQVATALATQLQKSVSESGLFYEAHQAKWIAGDLPTEALLQEPQNRSAPRQGGLNTSAIPQATGNRESPAITPAPLPSNSAQDAPTSASPSPTPPSGSSIIPEELRNIVQQQLDTAASQRMVWHGEVWPQQAMEWEIQRDAPERRGGAKPDTDAWTSRLALTTPNLGRVEATLELQGNGLRIAIQPSSGATADTLRQNLPALSSALEASGIGPLAIQVRQPRNG